MNSSPNLGHACGFYKLYIAEITFANSDKKFFSWQMVEKTILSMSLRPLWQAL